MTAVSAGTLKALLKQVRSEARLSQEQLASKAGVSVAVIKHIETGRTLHPSRERLQAIADALELGDPERTSLLGFAASLSPSLTDLAERVGRLEASVDRLEELLGDALDRRRRSRARPE